MPGGNTAFHLALTNPALRLSDDDSHIRKFACLSYNIVIRILVARIMSSEVR